MNQSYFNFCQIVPTCVSYLSLALIVALSFFFLPFHMPHNVLLKAGFLVEGHRV